MKLHPRFSYANVMSTLAVFLAVAGGSVAVGAVGKNDVGSREVDNNSLKSKDLRNGKAVRGDDVTDDSLTGADILESSLIGLQPSSVQPPSAFAALAGTLSLTGSEQDVVSTNIATTGTRVLAVGTLAMEGSTGNDTAYCRIRIAGVDSPEYGYAIPATGGQEASIPVTFARELGPGTHNVAMHCSESGTVIVNGGGLSVWALGS